MEARIALCMHFNMAATILQYLIVNSEKKSIRKFLSFQPCKTERQTKYGCSRTKRHVSFCSYSCGSSSGSLVTDSYEGLASTSVDLKLSKYIRYAHKHNIQLSHYTVWYIHSTSTTYSGVTILYDTYTAQAQHTVESLHCMIHTQHKHNIQLSHRRVHRVVFLEPGNHLFAASDIFAACATCSARALSQCA